MKSQPADTAKGAARRATRRLLIALLLGSLLVSGCTLLNPNPAAPITPVPPLPTVDTSNSGPPAPATNTTGTGAQVLATATAGRAAPTNQPVSQIPPTPQIAAPFVVYSAGKLATSWEDASYGGAKADYASMDVPRNGQPTLKVTYNCAWCAWVIADWKQLNSVDTSKYSHLHFWINGGAAGGQVIGVTLGGERLHVEKYIKGGRVPANGWAEVFIPLDDLGAENQTLGEITFQEVSGQAQAPYYIDDLEFYRDNSPPPTPIVTQAQLTVDLSSGRQPISPLIYGMSLATTDVIKDANIPLNRLGGNPYSRYNWTLGSARNGGSDNGFQNYMREPNEPAYTRPSGLADQWYTTNKAVGAQVLLTVPLLGYVAKDTSSQSTNVPDAGGAPAASGSEAIAGYDQRQNQAATSVKSVARKGAPFQDPPDPHAPAVYQDEWISHLTHAFGTAAAGGVRFYAMDNEPDLWADNTHVDVHPTRVGYDDLLKLFLDYAGAVKAVDPTAQVTGPVVSGWTGYWYSALDRGDDSFHTAADRAAHGGMPLLPWFLDQVHKHDQSTGTRTLDVLDIHYYPQAQGLLDDKVDNATSALRLRSTRSLWDPSYTDESWIGKTDPGQVDLIPRMKGWIDQYYPGTKLGITEWKWGAEGSMNGALAIAEVLGIYGREGVYLANYYTNPPLGSPGLQAFKMYRNFDGQGGTFGDVAVSAQASAPDKVSIFASEDTQTNQVKLMILNKTDREQMEAQIALRGGTLGSTAKVYQLAAANPRAIQALPDAPLTGSTLSYAFPPYSITLLVIDKGR